MKKVTISINGKAPFITNKRSDLEDLLEQMIFIHNTFRRAPECMFAMTNNNKTVVVKWQLLETFIPEATVNGVTFTDKLANKILEAI